MSHPITKSELISRYVAEVKRIIGLGAPKDVGQELESLLTESIDAQEAARGRELNLQEVSDILKTFGTPEVVADRYLPRPKYVIGPGLYPVFLTVVKAVLGAAAGVPLLVLLVSYLAAGQALPTVPTAILTWVGLSYQIAFGGLAWAVLVFAVLERVGVADRAQVSPEAVVGMWNPLDLPALDDQSRASRIGVGFSIYFTVAFLIAFNFFPEWIGLYIFRSGSEMQVLSLRDLGIVLPMWQLNLWWIVALLQNLLLFRKGHWTAVTRAMEFALGLAGAAILYPLVGTVGEALRREPFTNVVTNAGLAALLARVAQVGLTAAVLVLIAISVVRLYRLVRFSGRAGVAKPAGSTL